MLTFGSLFAGIGGFDLGLERAGFQCRWQVEIDPFCRRILEKHWPNVTQYEDVRQEIHLGRVDIIAGGFPCQDISHAGTGAGLAGERSGLWREMVRAVRVVGPRYVVVENVAALLSRGMGEVLGDLADVGYDSQWDCLSACAFGAPHVRRRVFIVANADSLDGWPRLRNPSPRTWRQIQEIDGFARARVGWSARMANPSALYRDADGLPNGMDRNRAIGNAVVPQIAEWIGRRILERIQEQSA